MKNRNIKAYDVNLISMERSFIFCFKTTYVSISSFFGSIVCCLFFSCFFTLWKRSCPWTPSTPRKFLGLNPPPPRNFQWPSVGGVWIFSGTTHYSAWMGLMSSRSHISCWLEAMLTPPSRYLFIVNSNIPVTHQKWKLSRGYNFQEVTVRRTLQ